MSTEAKLPSYLLQVTLLKTRNPTVSRLLSVPASINFDMLHYAIQSVFGWVPEHTLNGHWRPEYTFKVVKNNPFVNEYPERMEGLLLLQMNGCEGQELDLDTDAHETRDSKIVQLSEVFSDFGFREKSLIYDYDQDFVHAIQVLGRSGFDSEDKVTCLGGQGFTTQKVWRQGREGPDFVNHGGPSSWDFDLKAAQDRLQKYQESCAYVQSIQNWRAADANSLRLSD